MAVISTPLTLERFLQLPEEKPALEFADGVVTQKVSPKGRHGLLQSVLAERLRHAAVPEQHADVFSELRVTFGGVSRVPDLAVYRWDRVPLDETGRVADDFREPPDILIEIASPEQAANELVRKCLWYIAQGVQIALLVDPDDESVLRFSADAALVALKGTDVIDLGEIVPNFGLTVEELFAFLQRR